MAVYDNTDFAAPQSPSTISVAAYRIADFIDRSVIDLRHHIVRSRTERALSQLSNRQLADIGLHRSEIAAFSEAKARRWS